MSSHQPLWWIPAAPLRRFGEALDAVVRAWASDWGVAAPAVGLVSAMGRRELRDFVASAESLGNDADNGPWLKREPGINTNMSGLIFGTEASRSAIGREAGQLAAVALVEALAHRLRAPAGAAPLALASAAAFGHAGAIFRTHLGSHELQVAAPTLCLVQQGWLARPASKPLQPWSAVQALTDVPVTLTIELGQAAVSVGELSHIGPDDVIVVSRQAAEPITVRADGTDLKLRAFLGRQGSQRAVQFVSTSKRTP